MLLDFSPVVFSVGTPGVPPWLSLVEDILQYCLPLICMLREQSHCVGVRQLLGKGVKAAPFQQAGCRLLRSMMRDAPQCGTDTDSPNAESCIIRQLHGTNIARASQAFWCAAYTRDPRPWSWLICRRGLWLSNPVSWRSRMTSPTTAQARGRKVIMTKH